MFLGPDRGRGFDAADTIMSFFLVDDDGQILFNSDASNNIFGCVIIFPARHWRHLVRFDFGG